MLAELICNLLLPVLILPLNLPPYYIYSCTLYSARTAHSAPLSSTSWCNPVHPIEQIISALVVISTPPANMADKLYIDETPDEVKNAKVLEASYS